MQLVASPERIEEVVSFYLTHGEEESLDTFNLKADTLRRYIDDYQRINSNFSIKADLLKITENYTPAEIKAIAKGGRITPGYASVPILNFDGDIVTIGFITDTHIGSEFFHERYLDAAYREFEDCDIVLHSGDLSEGMSNRAGHIYELTHLGYDRQKEYCTGLVERCPVPIKMIDGNHDRWFMKSNGALIVKDVCEAVDHAEYLGQDQGIVNINGTVVMLWHGEDSSSYAISYRLQKLIEALSGGEKPNILLAGHTHKAGYFFIRNVHCISGGSIQLQSNWMRSKRIPAHPGFWKIRACISEGSVSWIEQRWYPFYA